MDTERGRRRGWGSPRPVGAHRWPNVWRALAGPGYLWSSWPWRSAAYLFSGVFVGLVTLLTLLTLAVLGAVLAVALVGLVLLALLALCGVPVAALERRRLCLVDARPVVDPHREPRAPGLRSWAGTRVVEQATWRELGHAVLLALVLWPLDALVVGLALAVPGGLLATPVLLATVGGGAEVRVIKAWTVTSWPGAVGSALLGVVALALAGYLLGVVAGARAGLARQLVAPRESQLDAEVTELADSRARLVDAFESERRRIERDLHDGAQQRLVALTVMLGVARLDAPPGPLTDQLTTAHREAQDALAELRELIHGIHPKVLTDYGLPAALADVAERSAVPVELLAELAGRPPREVESAAYFVVCEALSNIDQHSGAARAQVRCRHRDGELLVEVVDDGRGGAAAGPGTGLTGLADRVAVVAGRLSLSSPVGGPTALCVEIPCRLTVPSAPPCA